MDGRREMSLSWKAGDDCYTGLTANHVYKINMLHADRRWQLRVRDRARPVGVPLDDLWVTLGHYRNPAVAIIHANFNEEK
jgi:hypothetical protein